MIKNIIFDFGGVLLDLDMQRSFLALSNIMKMDFDMAHIPPFVNDILLDFECGRIGAETFVWKIQNLISDPKPQGYDVVTAWNAMLLGWSDPKRFKFLDDLRKKYNVYLLSNTNEIHMQWVYQDLKKNHNILDFDQRFFDKTYYSHIVNKRKPDADIFNFVLDDANLNPNDTLFIDDNIHNVWSASNVGIHVYHHNPKDNILSVFEKNCWN